jgi:hypothetical protein
MFCAPSTTQLLATITLALFTAAKSFALSIDRQGVAAHQDQLQNLVVNFSETRDYYTHPPKGTDFTGDGVQGRLSRAESFDVRFSFLNGNAKWDRSTDPATLKYWSAKGLPAIASQTESISSTGRVEQLTNQQFITGRRMLFGGFDQLNEFSPLETIDVALGLRLFGSRQWTKKDDLAEMDQAPSSDNSIVELECTDVGGHKHQLRFDKRLLFALVYYRCSDDHGNSVEIVNSDFHQAGSVFVPGKIVRTSNLLDSGGRVWHPLVFTIQVKHATVNGLDNTLDQYAIAWPAGLHLFDARTNDQVDVGATTRPFTDDDIRTQLSERRVREAGLMDLARKRIRLALANQPTTRP